MTAKTHIHLLAVSALCLAASTLNAAVITLNLGASTQNFTLTGLGPAGNGNGQYSIQQGACSNAAGLTTCTMSGLITGSSSALYSSGNYSFVTTYATSDVLPVQGQSSTPTSNSFFYQFLAPDVNMNLFLSGTPSGNLTLPMVVNGGFAAGTNFSFGYVTTACAGLPAATPCSQAAVGQVVGATISGPVTITASFTTASTPEPGTFGLTAISLLAGTGLWRRRRNDA